MNCSTNSVNKAFISSFPTIGYFGHFWLLFINKYILLSYFLFLSCWFDFVLCRIQAYSHFVIHVLCFFFVSHYYCILVMTYLLQIKFLLLFKFIFCFLSLSSFCTKIIIPTRIPIRYTIGKSEVLMEVNFIIYYRYILCTYST